MDLEAALRAAIQSENYEEALELVPRYVESFEASLEQAGDPAERARLITESAAVLRWAHLSVSAGRAHALARLNELPRKGGYLSQENRQSQTWQMEA